MNDEQLTALRNTLQAFCDAQSRGTSYVALVCTAFDQAVFHLRLHREKLAVTVGERRNGDTGAIAHVG